MSLSRRKLLHLAAGVGAAGAYPHFARAADYPTRPVTIIVPFAAGGATDILARMIADPMGKSFGQTVIVEDLTGAAGSIGVGKVAHSTPDGYTLCVGTLTTNVLIGGLYKLDFDVLNDLTPIAELAYEPLLICVKNSLPVHNLKELIAWLKDNPGKASVGIPGVGSTGNLAGLSFQKATGTTFQFVPYRGNGPAMQDLLAEQIDFMIEPASNFKGLVAAGSVKPFAITGHARLASSPDIPTADEAGLPGFFASLWYGLWVPKGTPKDVIAKLNATMTQVLFDPRVRQRFAELGIEITPIDQQSPEALRDLQKAESQRWWPIIKAANIKAE